MYYIIRYKNRKMCDPEWWLSLLPGLALTVVLPEFNFIGVWVLILSCAVRNPPFVTFALRIFLSRATEIAESLCISTCHPDIRKV